MLLLPRHAKLHRRAAGREDHRRGAVHPAAGGAYLEYAVLTLAHALHHIGDDLRPEFLGMIVHLLRELPPLDALESGVVLDQVGVEELTTRCATLDRDGLQHAAASVHGGGESGGAGAHDDQVVAVACSLRHRSGIPIAEDHPPPPGPAQDARRTARFRIPRPDAAVPSACRALPYPPPPHRAGCRPAGAAAP